MPPDERTTGSGLSTFQAAIGNSDGTPGGHSGPLGQQQESQGNPKEGPDDPGACTYGIRSVASPAERSRLPRPPTPGPPEARRLRPASEGRATARRPTPRQIRASNG